jgi:hypothetical protein
VPVILGSDKTTVSVATGQNDYYPLYASIGNVHNNVRRAHRNAVAVVGFLAIPKSSFSLIHFQYFSRLTTYQQQNGTKMTHVSGNSRNNSSIHHCPES